MKDMDVTDIIGLFADAELLIDFGERSCKGDGYSKVTNIESLRRVNRGCGNNSRI